MTINFKKLGFKAGRQPAEASLPPVKSASMTGIWRKRLRQADRLKALSILQAKVYQDGVATGCKPDLAIPRSSFLHRLAPSPMASRPEVIGMADSDAGMGFRHHPLRAPHTPFSAALMMKPQRALDSPRHRIRGTAAIFAGSVARAGLGRKWPLCRTVARLHASVCKMRRWDNTNSTGVC